MPHRQHLAVLRQCEADAAERGHGATDEAEQEKHFAAAEDYAAQIMAIEKQSQAD